MTSESEQLPLAPKAPFIIEEGHVALWKMFLVTGLPRIRSAWFTVLFQALGVDACHEYRSRFDSLDAFVDWLRAPTFKGWCDPSAVCLFPEIAAHEFKGAKVVIIERNPAESRSALQRWSGLPLPHWNVVLENLNLFRRTIEADVLTVQYRNLDRFEVVASVVRHCSGIDLPFPVWREFDLLKIEQHMPKARALWTAAA
jgi:hypothetical protein